MSYKIDDFITNMNEIYDNAYFGYGITQNNKRIRAYNFSIFNKPVNNIRTFFECINSKYWSCLENAVIMKHIANKNGLKASTVIVISEKDTWSIHGMIKIGNFYYDKNLNVIEVYTQNSIRNCGYKIYNINFDFGFNRNYICNEIKTSYLN